MDKPFEIIDHTADIGIVAYGSDIKELFANAALGLFSLMLDLDTIGETMERALELSAEDTDVLLVEWLNELIYIFDVEHTVFKRFEIDELTGNTMKARCHGEKINPQKQKIRREVKAATYHMLQIEKQDGIYKVQVIFDI